MKKAIVIILVLIAGVLFVPAIVTHLIGGGTDEPSTAEAPYVVQTYSSYYFAKQVTGTPPNLTITGYYYLQNGKWVYSKGRLTFNANWPAQVQRR